MDPVLLPENDAAFPAPVTIPMTRAPRGLSVEVESALRATGYLTLRGVDVISHYGIVFLRGRVPSYHMKQLAQAAAAGVPGIREIRNELDVVSRR